MHRGNDASPVARWKLSRSPSADAILQRSAASIHFLRESCWPSSSEVHVVRAFAALGLIACIAVAGTSAFAQTTESSLSGRVLDPSDAAVVGAQIIAIPEGSATGLQTTSDQTGQFTMKLAPGKYTVRV